MMPTINVLSKNRKLYTFLTELFHFQNKSLYNARASFCNVLFDLLLNV